MVHDNQHTNTAQMLSKKSREESGMVRGGVGHGWEGRGMAGRGGAWLGG